MRYPVTRLASLTHSHPAAVPSHPHCLMSVHTCSLTHHARRLVNPGAPPSQVCRLTHPDTFAALPTSSTLVPLSACHTTFRHSSRAPSSTRNGHLAASLLVPLKLPPRSLKRERQRLHRVLITCGPTWNVGSMPFSVLPLHAVQMAHYSRLFCDFYLGK